MDRKIVLDIMTNAWNGAEFLWSLSEGERHIYDTLRPSMGIDNIWLSTITGAELVIRKPLFGKPKDLLGWDKGGWGCALFVSNEDYTMRRMLCNKELIGGVDSILTLLNRVSNAKNVYDKIHDAYCAGDQDELLRCHNVWYDELNLIALDISNLATPGLPNWLKSGESFESDYLDRKAGP